MALQTCAPKPLALVNGRTCDQAATGARTPFAWAEIYTANTPEQFSKQTMCATYIGQEYKYWGYEHLIEECVSWENSV